MSPYDDFTEEDLETMTKLGLHKLLAEIHKAQRDLMPPQTFVEQKTLTPGVSPASLLTKEELNRRTLKEAIDKKREMVMKALKNL